MKELWPLEENKYKWVNIALLSAQPTLISSGRGLWMVQS